ncbi:MAG: ABC transporter substrate-binding protein [Alphaproteobacteria bacterium]|nr:ABC transporter substrate-binding protein [Alphaproteobacteria bacterium]MBU0798413.1 ABC transporter substrate-binding protein [Alphaproteobacteria bacterium]MBU1813275.1 ABC transporter substrate-binding protein [Alphaproteobacteria bacterium]
MNPKNFHISRRAFLGTTAAASVAGMLGGMPIRAFGKDQVKLSFMYPVGVSGDINRIVSGMIAAFNAAHADVQVEAIYAGSYDNTEQKVMTSLGVGDPPGTWLPINSALQTFLAMGALEDITALAKADDIYQDFLPGFLGTCISDDKLYGLPFQCSTPVLYYNKTAFEKAGVKAAPTTWDELLETAKALTIRQGSDVSQWGVTIGGGWHDWMFESYVRQNGLVPWTKEKVMFDAPESVNALEFWLRMAQEGVMPTASTWQGSANDFMAGRTAMLYHSTGSLTNLRKSSPFEVGVAFMPKNKTFGASMGGGPIHIAKNQPDAHKQACWTFARWMTNTANQSMWCKETGYLAARQSSWDSAEMKSFVTEVPAAKIALDQAAYAGAFLQVPGYHKVREYLKSALDRTVIGEIRPDVALREATVNSNREIDRMLRRRG